MVAVFDLWTIAGTVGTILFGLLSLIQWLIERIERPHVQAAKNSLQQLRSMCVEHATNISKGQKLTTQEARSILTNIAHFALGIEHHIDAMLVPKLPRMFSRFAEHETGNQDKP